MQERRLEGIRYGDSSTNSKAAGDEIKPTALPSPYAPSSSPAQKGIVGYSLGVRRIDNYHRRQYPRPPQ